MALTKSQIKTKINAKEAKKREYEKERDDYVSSIDYSGRIIRNLKACVTNYLSFADDSLKKYFTVDGKSADDGKISQIVNEINGIVSHMNNKVVPDLNYYKNYLDKEIRDLKNEIDKLWIEYNNAES